jgi:hypothetical protein
MSTIHNLAAFANGGLAGVQVSQRDWSPYLVHFTNWSAMAPVRKAIADALSPRQIANAIKKADLASFDIVKLIAGSKSLMKRSPNDKEGIPPCVCFSECNLPGLISHSERYGRIGFVFQKQVIFGLGGRPCYYIDRSMYAYIDKNHSTGTTSLDNKFFGLANIYTPGGHGKVQDYTHEREWRLFEDIPMDGNLVCLLAPQFLWLEMSKLFPEIPIIPIDILHQWGA